MHFSQKCLFSLASHGEQRYTSNGGKEQVLQSINWRSLK